MLKAMTVKLSASILVGFLSAIALSVIISSEASATSSGIDTPTGANAELPIAVAGFTGLDLYAPTVTPTQLPLATDPLTSIPNANFPGNVIIQQGLTVQGATAGVTSTAYFHSSDARLKTEIKPIANALDRLMAIKGVEFKWKQDGRPDIGVVAQNVAEVFPHIVRSGQDGMMAVEYDSLVGPIIESLRQLKFENEALKKKLARYDDLSSQIHDLQKTVADMKAREHIGPSPARYVP